MQTSLESIDVIPRARLVASGIDSLYVGFDVDLRVGAVDFDDLAFRKAVLKDDPATPARRVLIGGEDLVLHPSGRFPYTVILSNRDMVLGLAKRLRPSIHAQFRSEALWRDGADALIDRVVQMASRIGAVPRGLHSVIRVDVAFDIHAPGFCPDVDCFVSRARKDNIWRSNQQTQTITFGTGGIVIRVYDKSAEIAEDSGKVWFHDIWGVKDDVWRVELQLRGERLDEAGVATIADLGSRLNGFVVDLLENHTTLRRPTADRNRSRWPLHPLWRALIAAAKALSPGEAGKPVDFRNSLTHRRRELLCSITGNLKALGAMNSLLEPEAPPKALEQTLEFLARAMRNLVGDDEWRDALDRRITDYGAGQW